MPINPPVASPYSDDCIVADGAARPRQFPILEICESPDRQGRLYVDTLQSPISAGQQPCPALLACAVAESQLGEASLNLLSFEVDLSRCCNGIFTLRELEYELATSSRTLGDRQTSRQARQSRGVATMLDLRQSEQLVDAAAGTIPTLQQQIDQTERQINLLPIQAKCGTTNAPFTKICASRRTFGAIRL